MKCFLTNTRSLKNKLPEFHNLMYSRLPDIAFLTESWLNATITNNMLDPDCHYTIYRSDRNESKVGGGSIVFVKKRFKSGPVQIPDQCKSLIVVSGCDITCFDIYFKSAKYRFILVYRPPVLFLPKVDQVHKIQALTLILSSLSATKDTTFILGDVNLPNIDWTNHNAKQNGIDDVFMNCMSTFGMTQFVTNPTRLSFSTEENILDLILSNDTSSVQINDSRGPISSSDHLLLVFDVFVPYSTTLTLTQSTPLPYSSPLTTGLKQTSRALTLCSVRSTGTIFSVSVSI